jgi:predicted amidophosphoribosyltransferase
MTFKIPRTSKTGSTGFPHQKLYDEIPICPRCGDEVKRDVCEKCGIKVTRESIEPRREKDMVDLFAKTRCEFHGIKVTQALEIMSNGDCAD